jgi:hypothetical protein
MRCAIALETETESKKKKITSKSSLTCRKYLRHGTDGFVFPPMEGVLPTFNGLKNLSLSAGLEPGNIGSSGEHANH